MHKDLVQKTGESVFSFQFSVFLVYFRLIQLNRKEKIRVVQEVWKAHKFVLTHDFNGS